MFHGRAHGSRDRGARRCLRRSQAESDLRRARPAQVHQDCLQSLASPTARRPAKPSHSRGDARASRRHRPLNVCVSSATARSHRTAVSRRPKALRRARRAIGPQTTSAPRSDTLTQSVSRPVPLSVRTREPVVYRGKPQQPGLAGVWTGLPSTSKNRSLLDMNTPGTHGPGP